MKSMVRRKPLPVSVRSAKRSTKGMDIKTISHMLGHTDAGFTMNTYMHVTDAMQQNVADTMGELLKSKKDEREEKIIKFPA